jgi:hypothetical protein
MHTRLRKFAIGVVVSGASAASSATALANPAYTYSSTAPPGTVEVGTILGWILWGVGLLCVIGIMGAVAKMVTAHHGGRSAGEFVPALGVCVIGAIIAGAAGGLIPTLL